MKVVAALSGGVDSAVAAARAVDAGHEVIGVHLALSASRATHRNGSRGCCTLEDSRDARRIADVLGIPFYIWDLSEEFRREVVDDFVAEYAAGRTPNPCIRCNESIKFSAVLRKARALGFDAVCTGHYARLERDPAGGISLLRGVDPAKDQSYVLGVLSADDLDHSLFPLGDSTKSEVRAEAARRGLLVAEKGDSYDVCFIPDGDTGAFLRGELGERPGNIVDETGAVVGEHRGAYAFTVGQRRGLALSNPAEDGRARFVLSIEPVSNVVRVGPREMLAVQVVELEGYDGASADDAFGLGTDATDVLVQWRAHGSAVPARVRSVGGTTSVELAEPAYGIASGQELVMYREDRVVASARIRAAAPLPA
jgi:tRNA-specific 2-thiouridylase